MYSKSDRKVQFLLAILDCQVGQVKVSPPSLPLPRSSLPPPFLLSADKAKVDFHKLADKLGYKNERSAADSYYRFRRGLDQGASSPTSSGSNSSAARGLTRRKPRLRRKVICSDDDGEDEDEGEDEDSGGDAARCEIKQERIERDDGAIKLEGDTEGAIFIKSESEEEGDGVVRRNNRRRSGEEGGGGGFSGFQGAGYCCTGTGAGGSGFEGARFDGFGALSGLPQPLVVVERIPPERAVEKEGAVAIKEEPVDESWVWKW